MANAETTAKPQASFEEFWPFYVMEHSHAATRAFHFAGTALGWLLLLAGIALRDWRLILAAPVAPYPIVWFSHFFIEHNKPASFRYPAWSWRADQKMVWMMLTGQMNSEVERIRQQSPHNR